MGAAPGSGSSNGCWAELDLGKGKWTGPVEGFGPKKDLEISKLYSFLDLILI
jgi:hypothetical protein